MYGMATHSIGYAETDSPFCNHRTPPRLSLLELLCERAEIRSRNLHTDELARRRIVDALLHDIRFERALRRTERVATEVSRRAFLAGHLAYACHELADCREGKRLRQWPFPCFSSVPEAILLCFSHGF